MTTKYSLKIWHNTRKIYTYEKHYILQLIQSKPTLHRFALLDIDDFGLYTFTVTQHLNIAQLELEIKTLIQEIKLYFGNACKVICI